MGPLLVHLVAWVEVSSVMTCGHTCSGYFYLVEAQIAQEEAGPEPGYGRRNVGFSGFLLTQVCCVLVRVSLKALSS